MDRTVDDGFLEHFGVKGMKWGVRKKDSGSSGLNSPSKNKKVSSLTGGNEGAAILALYGGLLVTAVTAQKIVAYRDSGRKEARQTGKKEFPKKPDLSKKMTVSQLHDKVVKPINPGYGETGTKMNCRRATMAYEMRRRGYDVKATRSKYATGQDEKGIRTVTMTKGTKYESVWGEKKISDARFAAKTPDQKAKDIFAGLSTNPNGSRGELAVGFMFGGGHSMAWEIVNNKPVIFDTQNGKIFNSPKSFASFEAAPTITQVAQTRLDNKQINDEFVKRWVTSAV